MIKYTEAEEEAFGVRTEMESHKTYFVLSFRALGEGHTS